jgi:signal transduction histidine kinase
MKFNWMATLDPLYEHIMVKADVTKIAQALRNLLSNALKFSPEKAKIDVVVRVMKKKYERPANTISSFRGSSSRSGEDWDESVSMSVRAEQRPSPKPASAASGGFMSRMRAHSSSVAVDGAPSSPESSSVSVNKIVSHCYSGHTDIAGVRLEDVSHPDTSENVTTEISRPDSMGVDNLVCRIEVKDRGPGISKVRLSFIRRSFLIVCFTSYCTHVCT